MAKKKISGKKKTFRTLRLIFAVVFIAAAFSDGGGIEGTIGCSIIGLALLIPEIIGIFKNRRSQSAQSMGSPSASDPSSAFAEKPAEPSNPERALLIPQRLQGQRIAYKYENVGIYSPQECLDGLDLETIALATKTELRQEPENQYDAKAVAVYMGERKIGYLYKGKLQDMVNDYVVEGRPIFSAIQGIDDDNNKIYIALAFYKNPPRTGEVKTFKLGANKNDDMQETIGLSSEGEHITYFYDVVKEKYLASAGGDIGYFPKSAESYLDKDPDVVISRIDTADDGSLSVYVDILL